MKLQSMKVQIWQYRGWWRGGMLTAENRGCGMGRNMLDHQTRKGKYNECVGVSRERSMDTWKNKVAVIKESKRGWICVHA